MEANLTFDNYFVLETEYKFNPTFHEDEETISPGFSLDVKYNDEEMNNALLFFNIEFGDKDLEKNSVYVRAKILGVFSIKDGVDLGEDQKRDLYKINALSILYPYIRSVISDLTSKGTTPPVILPPINIVELVKQKGVVNEEVVNI